MKGVAKWTKPSSKKKKFQTFNITKYWNSNIPISLNIADTCLTWENNFWTNKKISDTGNTKISQKELQNLKEKNEELRIKCEILLHLLTEAELKKADIKQKVSDKKQEMIALVHEVESRRKSKENS